LLNAMGRVRVNMLARHLSSGVREWQMLPSGLARWASLKDADVDAFRVKAGHVVRVKYVARLDDGSELAKGILSFRIGSRSGGVCAALEEVCDGMRLGDTRRVRASPQSRRGKALASAPAGEMLEYDVTVTGAVAQRTIMTIEDEASEGANPLSFMADLGKRTVMSLYGPIAGWLRTRSPPK